MRFLKDDLAIVVAALKSDFGVPDVQGRPAIGSR